MNQFIVPFITLLVGFILGMCLGGLCIFVAMDDHHSLEEGEDNK